MIALVEGAVRQKTPNEIALNILIAGLTLIFLLAVATLPPYAKYAIQAVGAGTAPTVAVLVSLLVCLIPTTIGGLLSAIGIAGMDRVMQHNVLAMSGQAIARFVKEAGGVVPPSLVEISDRISRNGGTPLAVADGSKVLGIVHLKDIVKGGMRERLASLRAMGISSVMITGDNPLTAAAIAQEAGVDDFLAQATPKDKLEYIRKEQAQGRLVAMTGDGTNDAPA